jgi:hypothetical protein
MRLALAALCSTVVMLVPGSAAADPGAPTPTWVPDGPVQSVAISGSTAYFGGSFEWVAPYSGGAVSVDPESAERRSGWPEVSGSVQTAVGDGGGGWYLGGEFTAVGGVPRQNLAHVFAGGGVDAAWAPQADDAVYALLAYDDTVYAGGRFTTVNGTGRSHMAAFTGTTGALAAFAPDLNGDVRTFGIGGTLSNPVLYVGGTFSKATGANRHALASFSLVSGSLTGFDPYVNGSVYDIAVTAGSVYAGGVFSDVDSTDINALVDLDPVTGQVDHNWDPGVADPAARVFDIQVVGQDVYAVGQLGKVNAGASTEAQRGHAAAFEIHGADVTAWDPQLDQNAYALAVRGGTAYVGGEFTKVNGLAPRSGVAAVTADSGAVLPWSPVPHGTVEEIAADDSEVIVGGEFDTYGGVQRRNLAAIDLRSGAPTAFDPRPDSSVSAVAVGPSGVWAGGAFTHVNKGSVARSHLANFDPVSGNVGDFDQNLDNSVRALAVDGRTVYAGGEFTTVGAGARPYVAAFDEVPGTPGALLSFNPKADAPVHALALSAGKLFLGGSFSMLNGGTPRHYLGAVDPVTGVATSWDADVNQAVRDLTPVGAGRIVAAGYFTKVNGTTPRAGLAMLDVDTAAATAWDADIHGPVYAAAGDGEQIFAGGVFTGVGPRTSLQGFDSVAGTQLSWMSEIPGYEEPAVNALDATPNGWVVAGGLFTIDHGPVLTARLAVYPLPPALSPDLDPEDPGTHIDDPGTHPEQPDADRTAPVLRKLKASPKRFRVRRGTKLSFTLSESARVSFEVRRARGRRKTGRFSRRASAGAARVKFSGRLGKRRLKPGRYVVRATPTDAHGNVGAVRSVRLTVLRSRRSR